MSVLETAYEQGRLAALQKLGLAQPSLGSVGISTPVKTPGTPSTASLPKLPMPQLNTTPGPSLGQRAAKIAVAAPTHPTVKGSPLLGGNASSPVQVPPNPTTPATVKSVFDVHEQSKTRLEPLRKLGADLCTTCRKTRHYGPCAKPTRTRPPGVPLKRASFNYGMRGDEAVDSTPSTSSGYNTSVVQEEPGSWLQTLMSTPSDTTGRTFGRIAPSIQNTESVSIDQLGDIPAGEPAAIG